MERFGYSAPTREWGRLAGRPLETLAHLRARGATSVPCRIGRRIWYDAKAMPGDNVILVGFMGAGKSLCGRLLARRLGRCFVETDDLIVARERRSIPEIFRVDGEERFRQLEGEILEDLKLKAGEVIATGGGLPCREGRMAALRALGTVVWLSGDLATLDERARRTGRRPMLDGRPLDAIQALYRDRDPYYRQAHITVDTTALGPDQVVARVLVALRELDGARV
jgi:shikimate kinase